VVRALVVLVLLAGRARADSDLCPRNAHYRGATIDLDVKDADIHEVFRLLADTGRVNLVIPDEVSGKVTLKLHRVPWDQAACAIAATHRLSITVDGNILIVKPR